MSETPAIWFPTVRTDTGTDVFTERLVAGLQARGLRAAISWLPLRAEYAPWTVPVPEPPEWATACHISTWLHPRFAPTQLPVVATLHHSIHDPALHPYKGWLRASYHRLWIAPIEREVMHRADRVIAVSHFAADMARQTLCDVPMDVIYNGVDTTQFLPGKRNRSPGEPFRLLFVGSWMARKGVDLLAPIMRELGEGFELYYTGGPAAEKEKPCMPTNMRDTGRLPGEAVVAAMQNADAFLFPSRSEGFGLVAAEAMACGLPVIAMEGTSVEEIISHGKAGLLCAREDIHAFVNAVLKMAATPDSHLERRAAAREQIVTRFQISQMVDAYIQTYLNLMERRA